MDLYIANVAKQFSLKIKKETNKGNRIKSSTHFGIARLSSSQYDILYSTGQGQVVQYIPEEHGMWGIYQNEFNALQIRQVINEDFETDEIIEPESCSFLLPIEANLRDFLIKKFHTIRDEKLKLFADENGRDGKEYPTSVGPIDILTIGND